MGGGKKTVTTLVAKSVILLSLAPPWPGMGRPRDNLT